MKKRNKILWIILILLTVSFLLISCMKEAPQEVSMDIPVFDTEGLIGPDGGIVRIMDESSPIFGCYVAVRENALKNYHNISIKQVVSPDTTITDTDKIFIEFLPSGLNFLYPAEIGIVYSSGNTDSLQQFVYDEILGTWFPIPFRRIDEAKKLTVGLTPHFSTFTTMDIAARDIIFPDPGLDEAVRETVGLYDNETISLGDVYYIEGLDASNYDISDMTGIDYLKNLNILDISENSISSVSRLSKNLNLEILAANDNMISDLSPLSGLINLRIITLDHNKISNISPLSSLINLEGISLDNNQITDVSPLSSLINLKNLTLYKNSITSISVLSSLTKLEGVEADHNKISEIPDLSALDSLRSINLGNNPISNRITLTNLKAKNLVSISLDSCMIISFPDLPGLDSLKSLSVKYNQISETDNFTGFRNLTYLSFMGNKLTNIDNFQYLDSLRVLDLDENELTGHLKLANFKELMILSLVGNNLKCEYSFPLLYSDFSDLPLLTKLNELYLDRNHLKLLPDLGIMKYLETITLDNNHLNNIYSLSKVPNLRTVSAKKNSIYDLSCFDAKMTIESMNLDSNIISNLIPLGKNYSINFLSLSGNDINEIDILLGNPGLGYGDQLFLIDNPLSNTAIYEHIPVLQKAGVSVTWENFSKTGTLRLLDYRQRRKVIDEKMYKRDVKQKIHAKMKVYAE
ncbi:MAG: leucine-rich repeat domain-containing protein [Candidatus Delongbacteria bacterium]